MTAACSHTLTVCDFAPATRLTDSLAVRAFLCALAVHPRGMDPHLSLDWREVRDVSWYVVPARREGPVGLTHDRVRG